MQRNRLRLDCNLVQLLSKTPPPQQTTQIWRHLDTCANLANCGGVLEDGDAMSRMGQGDSSRKPTETAAYDEDVKRELRFASSVENEFL